MCVCKKRVGEGVNKEKTFGVKKCIATRGMARHEGKRLVVAEFAE